MSIVEADSNRKLVINDFLSGREMRIKLYNMGLHINDVIIKINENKWGPILVQNLSNNSMKVALGRGLAEKIEVSYED